MDAKVSFKSLKIVMVVAVLALAANQAALSQAPACTSFSQSVTVSISTVGDAAKVDPDRACVAKGGKVNWTATDGESWSADFADDAHSPFAAGRRHHAGNVQRTSGDRVKACSSGDARFDAGAGGCVYKYTAAHVKGGKTSTIDPEVVVKPGT